MLTFAKLLAGNRREQLINPHQKLLEFPDDRELQAVLEAARREAEPVIYAVGGNRTDTSSVRSLTRTGGARRCAAWRSFSSGWGDRCELCLDQSPIA